MIFGYTEDKNKVEVPSKEEMDERLSDTGWVTLAEAGTYGVFELSEPLEYRVIGNKIHWRTYIKSVKSGVPPSSHYSYGFSVNAERAPKKKLQKTFIAINTYDTNTYKINVNVDVYGSLSLVIRGDATISTATDINVGIELSYLLD